MSHIYTYNWQIIKLSFQEKLAIIIEKQKYLEAKKLYNVHSNNSHLIKLIKTFYNLITNLMELILRCLNFLKRHHRSVLKPSASSSVSLWELRHCFSTSLSGSLLMKFNLSLLLNGGFGKALLSTAVYHLGLDKVTLLGLLSAFLTEAQPRKETAFHLYHQHVPASAGQQGNKGRGRRRTSSHFLACARCTWLLFKWLWSISFSQVPRHWASPRSEEYLFINVLEGRERAHGTLHLEWGRRKKKEKNSTEPLSGRANGLVRIALLTRTIKRLRQQST